jgi:hypothetical protein
MPLKTLLIKPGVNTQQTPSLLQAGWAVSQLIRFRDGMLQKMGGWSKAVQTAFTGVCRGLHGWAQINGLLDMGVGTHLKLFLFQLGSFYDLTPVQNSGTSSTNFYTSSNGSASINVNISSHGAGVGDFYEALTTVTANGVTIFGEYTVTTMVDANNFTITAANNATASGSFGSGVQWQLLLSVGGQDTTFISGYGSGPYSSGGYGSSLGSSFQNLCRLWSIQNWGEFMLASPQNGAIYQWQPSTGTSTRASLLTNAPTINWGIIVGLPQQQVIAFGTNQGVGSQDPMLVAWSDVGNNTAWTASATNQAGTYRIPRGSKIVAALGSPLVVLIWTNEGLWLMQYQGLPFVYGFTQVGQGCGLVAPKAVAMTPQGAFWMSDYGNDFHSYAGGTLDNLPCTVRDRVVGNINIAQLNKIFTAHNSLFNEVTWFYPSLNSTEIDSYVKYNYVENLWDYGLCGTSFVRTAWEDNDAYPLPMATDFNSFLYNHETGTDADGQPMDAFAETGFMALDEAENIMFVERLIPDFNTLVGTLNLTIFGIGFPNSDSASPTQYGPFTVTPGVTPYVTCRARGRGLALKIESNTLGGNFRWGAVRARISPTGKR